MGKPKSFRKAPRPRRTGNANEAPLFIWDFEQCDSSKCSGRKLVRFNKIEQLNVKQHGRGVVLSPLAGTFLSLADREIILSRGLTVVDCSWNRIDEIPFDRLHTGRERKLPFIIAANPTHYGRPYELSCVEAMAFSLFLVGLQGQAADLLSIFKWGQSFLDLNRELLEFYLKRGTDSSAIESAEKDYKELYAQGLIGHSDQDARRGLIPSSDDEESDGALSDEEAPNDAEQCPNFC